MNDQKISSGYILAVFGAVAFTWLIHEFGHWSTGELFGYDTIMTLNAASFGEGESPTEWQRTIVSAMGPIITIAQAIVIFFLLRNRDWNKLLYPLLFVAFYMRFLAAQLNVINPNDEGRISAFLDLGTFTLPIIVSAFLFFLVYKISKKHGLNWKFQLGTTVSVMVFSSVLIIVDQMWKIRLL